MLPSLEASIKRVDKDLLDWVIAVANRVEDLTIQDLVVNIV